MERGYGNRLASSDILAKGGYSKQDVAKCLMKNAMVPARYFEWNMTVGDHHPPGTILSDLVEKGVLPREWCLSADADRLVPLMLPATEWLVVVTGDPMRNRSCIYRENFKQGYATSKKLKLPPNWDALMGGLQPLRKNS